MGASGSMTPRRRRRSDRRKEPLEPPGPPMRWPRGPPRRREAMAESSAIWLQVFISSGSRRPHRAPHPRLQVCNRLLPSRPPSRPRCRRNLHRGLQVDLAVTVVRIAASRSSRRAAVPIPASLLQLSASQSASLTTYSKNRRTHPHPRRINPHMGAMSLPARSGTVRAGRPLAPLQVTTQPPPPMASVTIDPQETNLAWMENGVGLLRHRVLPPSSFGGRMPEGLFTGGVGSSSQNEIAVGLTGRECPVEKAERRAKREATTARSHLYQKTLLLSVTY